jgi:hypothetical protein
MATPARLDITVWVGNHKELKFRFSSGWGMSTTTPYPLTGIRVNFTVFNGDTRILSKSTADTPTPTIIVGGVDDNEITLEITPEDTRVIAAEEYEVGVKPRYEVEFWDGRETTWIYGNLKLVGGANDDE